MSKRKTKKTKTFTHKKTGKVKIQFKAKVYIPQTETWLVCDVKFLSKHLLTVHGD